MQLFGVVWIGGLYSPINGLMLGLEAGFQTSSDTMLCSEEKKQDFHIKHTIYFTCRSTCSSGNVGLLDNQMQVTRYNVTKPQTCLQCVISCCIVC